MLYMIMSQGEEPILSMWLDAPPTLDTMAQAVAQALNYESVDALAEANPGLQLAWMLVQ